MSSKVPISESPERSVMMEMVRAKEDRISKGGNIRLLIAKMSIGLIVITVFIGLIISVTYEKNSDVPPLGYHLALPYFASWGLAIVFGLIGLTHVRSRKYGAFGCLLSILLLMATCVFN